MGMICAKWMEAVCATLIKSAEFEQTSVLALPGRKVRMLRALGAGTACMLLVSACGTFDGSRKEAYRNQELRFSKEEYKETPGVLMRASLGAWGNFGEGAKVTALIDYYADARARLKSKDFFQQLGLEIEGVFDSLSRSKFKLPSPRRLDRKGALKRVYCMNELYRELSKPHFRKFLGQLYPLFKVEAQCNAFVSRHAVQTECLGWRLGTKRTTFRGKKGTVTMDQLEGEVVNRCAS